MAGQLRSYGSNGVVNKAQNAFGECFAVKRLRAIVNETPLPDIPIAQPHQARSLHFVMNTKASLRFRACAGFRSFSAMRWRGSDPLIIMEWIDGISLADAFEQLSDNDRATSAAQPQAANEFNATSLSAPTLRNQRCIKSILLL